MLVGIYGASGFGREMLPLLREQCGRHTSFRFIDDRASGTANGCPILEFEAFRALEGEKRVVIAIADSRVRERLAARCDGADLLPLDVRAPDVVVRDECLIGSGAVLCDRVVVTSNVRIGRHFHANVHCYVAHDCVIGDFVTFAPAVICNGNIHVGDHAYIGAGAVMKQGVPGQPLRIGAGAVVGMGAVVTKDVPAGAVVVGNPARTMAR